MARLTTQAVVHLPSIAQEVINIPLLPQLENQPWVQIRWAYPDNPLPGHLPHQELAKVFCNEEKVATFKVDDGLISEENPGPQVFNSTTDSPWNHKAKESSGLQSMSNNVHESGTCWILLSYILSAHDTRTCRVHDSATKEDRFFKLLILKTKYISLSTLSTKFSHYSTYKRVTWQCQSVQWTENIFKKFVLHYVLPG